MNCRDCDDQLQKERGCEGDGIVPFFLDGERIHTCPIKMVQPISWEYIKAHRLYDKNMLPQGKGWLMESQKFLDAMMIVGSELNKVETNKMKKAGKTNGKKRGSS